MEYMTDNDIDVCYSLFFLYHLLFASLEGGDIRGGVTVDCIMFNQPLLQILSGCGTLFHNMCTV